MKGTSIKDNTLEKLDQIQAQTIRELKKYTEQQEQLKKKLDQQERLLNAVKQDISKRTGLMNYISQLENETVYTQNAQTQFTNTNDDTSPAMITPGEKSTY